MQRLTGLVAAARRRPKLAGCLAAVATIAACLVCGSVNIALNPSLLNTRTPRPTTPSPTVTITRTTAPTNTPEPTHTPRPSKTPTATPTERPTRTATPLPAPTSAGPKNYDKNGDGSVTCDDFNFQFEAQEAYDSGYTQLDGSDNDGKACETKP